MDTSIHVIQPFVAPPARDRRPKERDAKPFELANEVAPVDPDPPRNENNDEPRERLHEEGLGNEIDVVA
jgi:hypothetical protein